MPDRIRITFPNFKYRSLVLANLCVSADINGARFLMSPSFLYVLSNRVLTHLLSMSVDLKGPVRAFFEEIYSIHPSRTVGAIQTKRIQSASVIFLQHKSLPFLPRADLFFKCKEGASFQLCISC